MRGQILKWRKKNNTRRIERAKKWKKRESLFFNFEAGETENEIFIDEKRENKEVRFTQSIE